MAVYVAARDLAGSMAIIGTHQFLVIAPDSGKAPPALLPDGKTVFPKNLANQRIRLLET